MIDYEFRVITQTIRKIAKEKSKAERILLNKISLSHISNKNLLKLNNKYFKNLKKVTGLVYRGLPINNPKDFFSSESEVNIEFKKLKNNYNHKLKGLRLIQFPNPNLVSLKKFNIDGLPSFMLRGHHVQQFLENIALAFCRNIAVSAHEYRPYKIPREIYGTLKLAGEVITKGVSNSYSIPYTIIRPSALYGDT